MKEFKLTINLNNTTLKNATNIKYVVADTIEERGLGTVIDQGIFLEERVVEIYFEGDPIESNLNEISSILNSLGIGKDEFHFS